MENLIKVDNVHIHLQSSLKVKAYVHNILCLAQCNRMVGLKGEIIL